MQATSHVNDSIAADFNGDLLYDMVLTRGAMRPSGATLVDSNRIEAWLAKSGNTPAGKGFHFESEGPITVYIDHRGMGIYQASKVFDLDPQKVSASKHEFADAVRAEGLPYHADYVRAVSEYLLFCDFLAFAHGVMPLGIRGNADNITG